MAYADQRSTDLAVDNLNGSTVAGRTISVEHVLDYKDLRAQRLRDEEARALERSDAAADGHVPEEKNEARTGASAPAAASEAAPWLGGGGSVFEMITNARLQSKQSAPDGLDAAMPASSGRNDRSEKKETEEERRKRKQERKERKEEKKMRKEEKKMRKEERKSRREERDKGGMEG